MGAATAIETRDLGKRYGKVVALQDLSLAVEEGEVFGFLGPNGAGKTTTIRLLLGLLRPTTGTATVSGHAVGGPSVEWRSQVGYLPGELALWPTLTGAETLDSLARLTGREPSKRAALLEMLELPASDLRRRVRTYSDGMRQKLGIVQAFQCAPRMLLLDEPTKGLDPLMQQRFYGLIADVKASGATVFFSSHVLTEVERVSDRVGMLRGGRLVSVNSVGEIRQLQRRRVVAHFASAVDAAQLSHFGEIVAGVDRRVEMLVAQPELPALIARLGLLPLADLVVEPPKLEDVFLEQYR